MAETRARSLLRWGAVAALAGALAVGAYWLLFSAFMLYDDEGYVLLSLRNFSLHGTLYDQVYTQYGPFPYLCYDALHRIFGFAFDNTSGRWITWVNWLGTAALCSALVGRVTRSAVWSAFTLAGVFTYLWVMINEPVHPGGLTTLLVAVAACGGSELWVAGRFKPFAVGSGFVGAALLLTKINVGVFFVAACATWLAISTAAPKWRRILTWVAALGCTVLPYLLMRSLWAERWVQLYALVFAAAALGTILVGTQTARPVSTLRTWLWFSASSVAGVAGLCVLTVARGTTWHGLLDGVILEPLRHPGVYSFAMNWRVGSGALALVSLLIAAWTARGAHWNDPRFREVVAWARLVGTLLFLCSPLGIIPTSAPAWGMTYGLSLAWWFVLPLHSDERGTAARCWIALLLVFQALHAFPVSGSQLNWGTYLWVPLLAMGMHDAAPVLAKRFASFGTWSVRLGVAGVLATTLVMSGKMLELGWTRYSTSEPLLLKGAENLRMPDEITYALRIVDENLRTHGDMLFSAPGLYSANLWSGLPTPTLANATHWFSLLSVAQQQEIVDRLSSSPRSLLLIQRGLLDYLVKNGYAVRGPLQTWLRSNFEPAFSLHPYEIWTRRGRSIAPLSTARVLAPDFTGQTGLTLVFQGSLQPIASVEICDVTQPQHPLVTLTQANSSATIVALTPDGKTRGFSSTANYPITASGLVRLTLRMDPALATSLSRQSLVRLRTSDGGVIGNLRVLPND